MGEDEVVKGHRKASNPAQLRELASCLEFEGDDSTSTTFQKKVKTTLMD